MDGGAKTEVVISAEPEPFALPHYLVRTYSWAYLRPGNLPLLDNHVVVASILWGNYWKLVRAACSEFGAGEKVLQAANVYGNLSANLANILGSDGHLEVIDIAPLQVNHCRKKLRQFPQVHVRLADAAAPGGGRFDGVCCFFLLHEIPDEHKRAVVDALLEKVDPGRKVVFVDYHKPAAYHPLRFVMHQVFNWLEPYAFGLIDREIRDFASNADDFTWQKTTYFMGLYQKVVAQRHS